MATIMRRLAAVPFAVLLALLGVNSAVILLIDPNRSVVHALTTPWDYVWAAQYGLGGAAIIAGIGFGVARLEAAGCVAFAGGTLIQSFVTALVLGWSAWNSVLVLVLFTGGASIRAWHIAQGKTLILTRRVKVVEP